MSAHHQAASPSSAVSHAFLADFASQLHLPSSGPPQQPPAIARSPPSGRKPRRRLRPIPLTPASSSANDKTHQREPRAAAFAHAPDVKFVTHKSNSDTSLEALERRMPTRALCEGTAQSDRSILRVSKGVSVEDKKSKSDSAEQEETREQRVEWSDALQQQAIVHASHIRTIANESALFLEALQNLHQLAHTSLPDDAQQHGSSPILSTSSATRSKYCQVVLTQLHPILRTFPIPIQRSLCNITNEGHFPQPATQTWLPPHPPHISFRLLQEEGGGLKPISHRLTTNLETTWDSLLDMLRIYCGQKKEPAGTFYEQELQSLISSLHPCNTDIFAARFVNLISTHTINAQQPTHIRLLDQRLQASSTSSQVSDQNGVTLHRVPQCVLVTFDDIPAHKFFARFLILMDSARLNTALLPRFLSRLLHVLNKVSTVASNHEFCDTVLEARLYARFLSIIIHTVNWAHSPFAMSGSSPPNKTSSPQSKGSGNRKVHQSDISRFEKPQDHIDKQRATHKPKEEKEGSSEGKSLSARKQHRQISQTLRSKETPGLGPQALHWRAWLQSPLWQNVLSINGLIISAVSSKQVTAVVAAAAVADVLLRFAAVDPVAKSSTWFQHGLSAMKKLRVVDESDECHMPLVQFLKIDLFACDQIDPNDAEWRGNEPLDDEYVLRCDSSEWSAIGSMRLLQECCTSLARFRKNLATRGDSKLQKTASRRITPRMTGSTTSPSPLNDHPASEANGTLEQKGHEKGDDQDADGHFRREFLCRLDSRLLELMQIVKSSYPASADDARRKYMRVSKALYPNEPVTVRAVAAHICGHQVEMILQSSGISADTNAK
eukprot:TRINITY_DN990_c0_g1_i1.p1 TRINITY_DN990_c0_g1~~TRINITY_DN990_c0_g1_i1.p1  ORF type:complete len:834 (-),score=102.78 TRINITY_DN990_c0_g1_i1:513-3014(-)